MAQDRLTVENGRLVLTYASGAKQSIDPSQNIRGAKDLASRVSSANISPEAARIISGITPEMVRADEIAAQKQINEELRQQRAAGMQLGPEEQAILRAASQGQIITTPVQLYSYDSSLPPPATPIDPFLAQLEQFDVSSGFGMKKYDELKAMGATDEQIKQIAERSPIIGDRVASMFPELSSWGSGEKADFSRIPPGFDWTEYVKSNPDLILAGIDTGEEARRHYAIYGFQENRAGAPAPLPGRDERYQTIRTELENQYNNLVQLDPNAAYRGRVSDLPKVFNQQAAQLADAGVTSITNLRIQDGRLVDSATGNVVTNSNLGGQVAVDRDTGVQKWGDIFSGVQGGANYGIQALEDGSVVLFPAYEKSKSLTSQVLGSDLFKVASLALAGYGLYNLGTTLAGAGGAEAVTAAAGSGAGGGAGLLDTATLGGLESMGGGTGISAVASASPSLAAPIGVAAPGVGEGISLLTPAAGGAATIAGLQTPGLSSMGGAQGITVPVQGGVVSEMGFVPVGATPSLGDPSSFINNPDYLGSPVISEDYLGLTASDMPSGMNIQDALRMARTGMQLFGPQQQQLLGSGGYGGGGGQAAGVDSSGLLGLLQGKAGVPGVSPLLTPVSIPAAQPQPLLGLQMPQYQPLLGTTTQSLLG